MHECKRKLRVLEPEEVINPEKVVNGDVGDDDLYESREKVTEPDIIVNEEDVELTTTEVLEDIGVIDSHDDFSLNE